MGRAAQTRAPRYGWCRHHCPHATGRHRHLPVISIHLRTSPYTSSHYLPVHLPVISIYLITSPYASLHDICIPYISPHLSIQFPTPLHTPLNDLHFHPVPPSSCHRSVQASTLSRCMHRGSSGSSRAATRRPRRAVARRSARRSAATRARARSSYTHSSSV